METLDHIKKIEKNISEKIQQARTDSEERILLVKESKEKKIEESKKQGILDAEREFTKDKKKALMEAKKIEAEINFEIKNIQDKTKKNMDKSVKIIIDEFLNL